MSITNKHINEELKKMDLVIEKGADEKTLLRYILKADTINVKLLHDVRFNLVKIGEKLGVTFRKAQTSGRDFKEIGDKKIVEHKS